MANETSKLVATVRTETGKGAARRARRAGNVPAVLYGHGTEARPLSLPTLELAAILRNNGVNAIIDLEIDGESQLALTKQVDVHPTKNYIEHLDLLVVKKGEKVTVEVVVVVEGDAKPGTLVTQDANTIEVEADALSIPEQVVVSVEDAEVGYSVTAADLSLPDGATVLADPETLIVAVNAAPTAADLEAEIDAEGAGVEEDAPESAEAGDDEGESKE